MLPIADPGQEQAFVRQIVQTLGLCAIRPDRVAVKYVDDLQSYEIVIDEGPLAVAQVAFVFGALLHCGDVSFAEPVNARLHREIEHEFNQARLKLWAADHPDLPRFDPSRTTLVEFARELEIYCGLEPGSALEVSGKHVRLRPNRPPGKFEAFGTLIQAVSAALVDLPEYTMGVLGGSK